MFILWNGASASLRPTKEGVGGCVVRALQQELECAKILVLAGTGF